jgi:uncharacterized membrane protein YoaK (UPF0700 family)
MLAPAFAEACCFHWGPSLLSRLERHQPVLWNLILVGLLPCIAGAINASGLFIVGRYTSHVTGSLGRIGDELAQGNYELARSFIWMVGAFFVGAIVSAALLRIAQAYWRVKFAAPLVVEALALLAVALIGLVNGPRANLEGLLSMGLLSSRWACRTRW